MNLFVFALKSAKSRKVSLLLAILCISISIFLLIGIDKIKKEVKKSFLNTISQTDLIVGARSGPINLLLYSVFHIGNATSNLKWQAYQNIIKNKKVEWAIPISLGDSHKNHRVVGTSKDFFIYYRYASGNKLNFLEGKEFSHLFEVVLGYEVAKKLNYKIGDKIIIAHGLVASDFSLHKDNPFVVSGILEKTFTAIDNALYVTLDGLDAIHEGWSFGMYNKNSKLLAKKNQNKQITAFLLGLKNKIHTFSFMSKINNYQKEPLLAILPGATLATLWRSIGNFEQVLNIISYLVLFASIITLLIMLLSTLHLRRREMTILRCLGAKYYHIFGLYMLESVLVTILGALFAVLFFYISSFFMQSILVDIYNINIKLTMLDSMQIYMLLVCVIFSVIISLIPGIIAYKKSLLDGLRMNH